MTARWTAGAAFAALALTAAAGHAQDPQSQDPKSVVVNISGPCELVLDGRTVSCSGVAYMAFPGTHRIDFTALTSQSGWAFSGEQDDNEKGSYSLTLDSVLSPDAGRLEADGECDMQVADDGRTVRSIDCQAKTAAGDLVLKASGVVASTEGDPDDGDDDDDGDGTAQG
jgi:hypothetical protein